MCSDVRCGLPGDHAGPCAEIDIAEAERLFGELKAAQTEFWSLLSEFERCIGGEVDGNDDFSETDLASVIENKGGEV